MRNRLIVENRAATPAPEPSSDMPDTWEATVAMLAEATTFRFEALERDRAEEHAGMLRQIEDLASLVRTLTDRRAEDVAAITAHAERADGLARQVADLQAARDDDTGKIKALNQALDAAEKRADDLKASLLDMGEQIDKRADLLAEGVADVRGVAEAAVKGIETLQGVTAKLSRHIGELEDSRKADGEAVARGFVGVNERVDELHQAAGEVADEVRDAVAAAAGAVDQVARISARAGDLLNQVPAGWIIDRAGELVRISAAGETVSLGPVVGRDGADGKDGTNGADGARGADAPQIIAAAIEGNRLRLIQSDGIEHGCELPLQAVAAATPKEEPGPDVDDMRKMRAKGDTLAVIGKKYNISGSYVSRLIKKAEQNEPK